MTFLHTVFNVFHPEDIAECLDLTIRACSGESLKARREAARMSQQRLGELSGVTQQAISAIENGVAPPSIYTALRLYGVLVARLGPCQTVQLSPPTEGTRTIEGREQQLTDELDRLTRALAAKDRTVSMFFAASDRDRATIETLTLRCQDLEQRLAVKEQEDKEREKEKQHEAMRLARAKLELAGA